jgi:hypothetical protein
MSVLATDRQASTGADWYGDDSLDNLGDKSAVAINQALRSGAEA